jgi:hypothetical protein
LIVIVVALLAGAHRLTAVRNGSCGDNVCSPLPI